MQESIRKEVKSKVMSVIVTVYNTPESYLRKCLDSIINQTLKEIEIIIVNDGSKEEIKAVCEEYANTDNRIKLINQGNMGVSVARNVGMENVTTDSFIFVDSDDWVELNTCEVLNEYANKIDYNYDIIIFNCYVDYKTKSVKNMFYPKEGLLEENDIEQIQLQNIEKGITKYYPKEANVSVICSKLYNKKFMEKNNIKSIPNLVRMEDAIFNQDALEHAKNVYVLQKYLYHYKQNELSVCKRYSKDTIKYYETYIQIVREYIEKYNKNQKFADTLNLKIVTSIDRYMYNYFFHKDNKNNFKSIEGEFKELLDKDLYCNAMKNAKIKYLSVYQRLVLYNAKKKRIKSLKLLNNIKRRIKCLKSKNLV